MATKSKTKTSPKKSPKKRVTRRVVDVKRHTTGYIVGGEFMTVAKARIEAERGKIAGVRVVGRHIQAAIGRKPLSNLPTTVSANA